MPLSAHLRGAAKWIAGFVPPRYRQSATYWKWREFLESAQFWDEERIRQWQTDRLRQLVSHAVKNTRGYRELYRKAGVKPEDIRCPEDIRHFPLTTKQMFRDHLKEFTVPGHKGRYVTTGGSTGIPFGFFESRATNDIEKAFIHAAWAWAGWELGQESAVLRGGFVGSPACVAHYSGYHRELALSSYYLSSQTLPKYLQALAAREARVLQAYPSSLNLFCDLLRDSGAEAPALDLILLGSENVYRWQLDKFVTTFPAARFFSWYGHCEKAILGPWCEKTQLFHCWPFYGYTEVLGDDAHAVAEGEEGHLVGTSFHQEVTPFIRYQTMDRAVKGPNCCPECQRQFPMLSSISGRSHEVIVTGTGRYISMTALNMHDEIFDPLRQFQFLQENPGRVEFHYISKNGPLTAEQSRRIERGLMAKLGNDVELTLRPASEFSRTRSGKFKFLDQRLKIRYGDK